MQERDGLQEVRHVSVSINRPPADVYAFVSSPENLPKWAAGLCKTVRWEGDELFGDGGVLGKVRIRLSEPNRLGVLDHDVELADGRIFHNPIRVLANGGGSELTFSVFRQPGFSNEEFAEDYGAVEKDLRNLKSMLERAAGVAR